MGPFSRRDALRGGRDLAALLSLSTLAGAEPPVRTTIAAAGGIPGNSLVKIDCIAAI